MGKTLIMGASSKPIRAAYRAARLLDEQKKDWVPIGKSDQVIFGKKIHNIFDRPNPGGTDTITLYMNPKNQKPFYDYFISLQPRRIIFNPGAENSELTKLAHDNNIKTENACTLVMLSMGTYDDEQ